MSALKDDNVLRIGSVEIRREHIEALNDESVKAASAMLAEIAKIPKDQRWDRTKAIVIHLQGKRKPYGLEVLIKALWGCEHCANKDLI